MNNDSMELGSTPVSEDCQQLGTPEYDPIIARGECRVFINQLLRQFSNKPENVRFRIKLNQHDFGEYYEVETIFDADDEKAVEYMFNIEANLPECWDEEAKIELEALYAKEKK